VSQCWRDRAGCGGIDLESYELGIRDAMHGVGSKMLEALLNADGGDYSGRTIACDKGHAYEFVAYRKKNLLTVLGEVSVNRAYYHDKACNVGFCPKDRALDIEDTSKSPGVRRMTSKVGSYRPFAAGHDDLYELAGIRVTAKEVERVSETVGEQVAQYDAVESYSALSSKVIPIKPIVRLYVSMDGTGVPMVKEETLGRRGKGEDGHAKTREVKLGCVFTQTTVGKGGRPVRDEASTS
jgi:hypothetical protein